MDKIMLRTCSNVEVKILGNVEDNVLAMTITAARFCLSAISKKISKRHWASHLVV